MIKKFCLVLVFIALFIEVSHSYNPFDRFTFLGVEPNGCEWLIDTTSINRNPETGYLNYWAIQTISDKYRQQILNEGIKFTPDDIRMFNRLAFVLVRQDVDIRQQLFRNTNVMFYDVNGLLLTQINGDKWTPITPTSPVEGILIWMSQNCPAVLY